MKTYLLIWIVGVVMGAGRVRKGRKKVWRDDMSGENVVYENTPIIKDTL